MTITKAYQSGWKKVRQNKRMWILLYLLNFVFALLSAIPFSGFLKKSLGNTLATSKMLDGFDYAFMTDFLREYGGGFSVIMNLSVGIILLYFLFSIFWMGGILSVLKNENEVYSFQKFWQGSAMYFWKLIRLTFYFAIAQALVFGLFALLFLKKGISPFELDNEMQIIHLIWIVVPIYLFIATIIFMIQDYIKVQIIHNDEALIFQSIKTGIQFVLKNFSRCLGLYFLNLLTFLIFFGIYWILSNSFKSNTTPAIILLFFIGQGFLVFRIALKLVNLGSAIKLYQSLSTK